MKKRLILEFNEFTNTQLNNHTYPSGAVNDNQLTHNAFNRHNNQFRDSNIKLNNMLNTILGSTNFGITQDKYTNELEFSNFKILRIFDRSNDIDVYFSFFLKDEVDNENITEREYYGSVKNFYNSPNVKCELFEISRYSKEWLIKTKGIIVKVIKKWLCPIIGNYKILKGIEALNNITGEQKKFKKGDIIYVENVIDRAILISYNDKQYKLHGRNFNYFNYWFEKL